MRSRPVFLLTDFGPGAYYPGVMRGVVRATDPALSVLDLTHGVRPGDVREAGHVLEAALPYLPRGAVVAAVVDPGVGTERRVLCVHGRGPTVVAPDNGLATGVLAGAGVVARVVQRQDLELPDRSATFHGRDVFAPLAARVAAGMREEELGPVTDDPVHLPGWWPEERRGVWHGRVVHADPFGNLVTNFDRHRVEGLFGRGTLVVAERALDRWCRTYCDAPPGALLLYFGSSGHLEVGVRDGSAADVLGAGNGAAARLA